MPKCRCTRRVRRAIIAKKSVQVFKSHLDERYSGIYHISSHDGRSVEAVPVDTPEQIARLVSRETQVVAIDEAQFLDPSIVDLATALANRGARVILATAPDGKAMGSLVDGLGVDGKLVLVGASSEPFAVTSFQLLMARKSILGWPSGTAKDSEDTLRFAAANGVRPMIEIFPLERAADGYEHMMSGKVRFRSVLKI